VVEGLTQCDCGGDVVLPGDGGDTKLGGGGYRDAATVIAGD
jgi:hypothetical protein